MLRELKVVMQAFRNDHHQGTQRTPTCEPCMTKHTRTRQDLHFLYSLYYRHVTFICKIFQATFKEGHTYQS